MKLRLSRVYPPNWAALSYVLWTIRYLICLLNCHLDLKYCLFATQRMRVKSLSQYIGIKELTVTELVLYLFSSFATFLRVVPVSSNVKRRTFQILLRFDPHLHKLVETYWKSLIVVWRTKTITFTRTFQYKDPALGVCIAVRGCLPLVFTSSLSASSCL